MDWRVGYVEDEGMDVVCEPGWVSDCCFLIDGYGWRAERSTCVLAVKGSRFAAIVDAAHKSSAPFILRGIRDAGVESSSVRYILVTHRHTDHAGGVAPLLKAMPDAAVMGHRVTLSNIRDPSRINEASRRMWGDAADPMDPVEDAERLIPVSDGDVVDLGGGVEVEVVHTPGHTSDHYAYYERKSGVAYLGDAGGLFSCPTRMVVPTSFPASFKVDPYIRSLEKLMGYDVDVLVFAHFGAIRGKGAADFISKCIEVVEEWVELAKEGGVKEVAGRLKEGYLSGFTLFNPEIRSVIFDALAAGLVNALRGPRGV
ncbi:MAG: MBL fold metallo-hydrolase [Candidatus Freyarchaeota archaeon]|nr:MBL fold metallo-hydrolase [Candidatus Freyrarchaeum guaymaensis]